jgi:hypothetical protein
MNKKKIYFNPPQQEVMYTGAHTVVFVGGRRIGKTHGVAAPFLLRNVQRMPGSSGAFVASTYKRALTNTIPGTLAALESWGYKRDIHYFIGRKPPKVAGFGRPRIEPAEYKYVISFYNGSIIYIISQDRPGTSNSLTLDYLICDESKFLDYEKLKDETFPANGGYKGYFGNRSYHHSLLIISDMPTTKKGSWFLRYQDKSDPELIQTIQGVVFEIWKTKDRIKEIQKGGKEVPAYLKYYLKKMYKDLAELRSICVYYKEFSSIENLEVLGESYIKQMKRDLPPLVFQTSILCQRVGIMKDGFYNNMREHVNYYVANNNSYLDSLEYKFDKISDESSLQDSDVNPNAPICIGMDYNANINWIVAGQPQGRTLRVLKSFYVKYERKLREVVQDFCKYYRHHKDKTVIFYYDGTALGSNYAVNDEDFKSVVENEFRKNGWKIRSVHIGNPMRHMEKWLLISEGFSGKSGLIPMLNSNNNEELILAMETTGVYKGAKGFKKDKRGEKLAETEEDRLEYRTDGTDAFDTLYIGCTKFPQIITSYNLTSTFV